MIMKRVFNLSRISYEFCKRFYKDQSGVYMYMGGMLAIVLLGLAALAVDGSGIYLDKARFVQAMDQGALAVATENNTKYREIEPNHADVNKFLKDVAGVPEDKKFSTQQYMRNQELVQGIVKLYMRSYDKTNPNSSDLPIRIEDEFNIDCKEEVFHVKVNGVQQIKKPIICELSGEIKRKSWLPLDNKISFGKEVDIASGVTYSVKDKGIPAPMDLVLVLDFSSSMLSDLSNNYRNVPEKNKKITILREVVAEISEALLPATNVSTVSPYNRIGFVTFASAAQQNKDRSQCVLPYYPSYTNNMQLGGTLATLRIQIDSIQSDGSRHPHSVQTAPSTWVEPPTDFYKNDIKRIRECEDYPRTNPRGKYCQVDINVVTAMERALKLERIDEDNIRTFAQRHYGYYYLDPATTQTVTQIRKFNGSNIKYPLFFKDAPKRYGSNEYLCGDLKTSEYTTQAWFDKDNKGVATALNKIPVRDGTNVTSGFLVGANILMGVNKDPNAAPKVLGSNTQRILLVLSDGQDNFPAWDTAVELLKAGMCQEVRNKANSLRDPDINDKLDTKIGFVAFGYTPDKTTGDAWKACVGEENFFLANNKEKLLESFKQIIGLQEEVGKTSTTRPTF